MGLPGLWLRLSTKLYVVGTPQKHSIARNLRRPSIAAVS